MIDKDNHVFGYENLMVCDGSAVPANPGVNPEPDDHRDDRTGDEQEIPPKDPAAELLHLPDEARPARTADTQSARPAGPASGSAESGLPSRP